MSPSEMTGALYWPLLDSGLFFALRLSTLGHSRKEKVQIRRVTSHLCEALLVS